jgi:hypothetical protein
VVGVRPPTPLVAGPELAQLMIDHNLGASPTVAYEVKRIDADYFTEQTRRGHPSAIQATACRSSTLSMARWTRNLQ